mmetsp:Transcript_25190/g.64444  ORF Transcript_25190/g.64444 Transcript_25190/m.64444 type:complete len:205 (-) Transcript_25190:1878-2492(-)
MLPDANRTNHPVVPKYRDKKAGVWLETNVLHVSANSGLRKTYGTASASISSAPVMCNSSANNSRVWDTWSRSNGCTPARSSTISTMVGNDPSKACTMVGTGPRRWKMYRSIINVLGSSVKSLPSRLAHSRKLLALLALPSLRSASQSCVRWESGQTSSCWNIHIVFFGSIPNRAEQTTRWFWFANSTTWATTVSIMGPASSTES